MKQHVLKILLASAILLFQLSASAEDIDLFVNPPANATDVPNVLFIIDNTANWNSAFTNEMAALANTLHNMPVNADGTARFNVGFMFATETGGGNNNIGGGYVRAAVRPMNTTNKALYEALVNNFDQLNDKGNGGASGITMAEAYYYFQGLAPYAGNQKVKTDYTGSTCTGCNLTSTQVSANNAVYALAGNALASKNATTYKSPVAPGSCAKNYIIYISNGPNQENNSADTLANNMLTSAGGDATMIPLSPAGSQTNPSDEWARFMNKRSGLGIVTFAVDVNPVSNGQGPGWTRLLKSMSKDVGGGEYYAVSSTSGSADIQHALNDALSQIQSVNTVFAAVSLPASATVQGAYLNQIFIGMFRPDQYVRPRWIGNLKQYKLGSGDNLVDADSASAINANTGFIAECARSYWTPSKTNTDSYWINDPKGACIPPGADAGLYARSNTPDGNVVEKGAQAYVLRQSENYATRTVKTCSSSFASCTSLLDFNNTNVTAANLGAADNTERDLLINWAKGQNVDAELGKAITEMRPSAHGDVIHSNPMAISFGSNVVVFYGSNDGMLRAVNGNQNSNIGSVVPGAELWSFMPPEFFGNIKRLRDNTTLVSLHGISGAPKPYGIDGPIAAYKDANHAWLYTAMRRGGRVLYAFDVTNPASPSLKWKKGCPNAGDDTNCSTGLEGIGQTWSLPQPVKVPGYASGAAPVIIMGGGYDTCEDGDPNTCTNSTKGNKIFVLDADTGALLKTLTTDRAVVADVKVVPGADGTVQYAYAADLGGNLYRITIGQVAPANWTITKIASLGCDTVASCSANRKFMFAPSVVREDDGGYGIYIGTGDREKPLTSYTSATSVRNYFFKVKDKPEAGTWLSSEQDNCSGQSVICLRSLLSAGSTNTGCSGLPQGGASDKGWYMGLRPQEQVVTTAATRFGVTTFDTHIPAVSTPGACTSNLGTTHVYNIDLATAQPTTGTTCNDIVAGGGLPPLAAKKDICMNDDCSQTESICFGCSTDSPIQSNKDWNNAFGPGQTSKHRVYWYIQQ
jgi:type IV pilus assembly protein PilY1